MVDAIGGMPQTSGGATRAPGFSGTGADFETFLTMLTAQLRNQDPLNPMQSTDFAVQLATFASVEQQAMTNSLLTKLTGQGASGLASVADWIGKEARTTEPVLFTDRPLTLDIVPDPMADSVRLVAYDGRGREIGREEIGLGAGQVDWFGRDEDGTKLPDGQVWFEIENWRGGVKLGSTPVGAYGRIVEAETGPDGPVLIFEGGGRAAADQISAIRAAR